MEENFQEIFNHAKKYLLSLINQFLNLMTLVCNLNLCVYAYNGAMYCGKIPMPKSQNPCLEAGIYLSFVLLIEGWIESIKRLVQVANLNPPCIKINILCSYLSGQYITPLKASFYLKCKLLLLTFINNTPAQPFGIIVTL
uniref:hypothetical protein n=1 Tax=Candidatus Kuenenia sp. TaxID=2499824 RepID=UPI0032200AC4